jgi:hypothetical protein
MNHLALMLVSALAMALPSKCTVEAPRLANTQVVSDSCSSLASASHVFLRHDERGLKAVDISQLSEMEKEFCTTHPPIVSDHFLTNLPTRHLSIPLRPKPLPYRAELCPEGIPLLNNQIALSGADHKNVLALKYECVRESTKTKYFVDRIQTQGLSGDLKFGVSRYVAMYPEENKREFFLISPDNSFIVTVNPERELDGMDFERRWPSKGFEKFAHLDLFGVNDMKVCFSAKVRNRALDAVPIDRHDPSRGWKHGISFLMNDSCTIIMMLYGGGGSLVSDQGRQSVCGRVFDHF